MAKRYISVHLEPVSCLSCGLKKSVWLHQSYIPHRQNMLTCSVLASSSIPAFFIIFHVHMLLFTCSHKGLFSLFCRPVGMPKMEKVYLHNPSAEEISLISISATTAHFHASFFQNRVSTFHSEVILFTSFHNKSFIIILQNFASAYCKQDTYVKVFPVLCAFFLFALNSSWAL